MIRIFVAITLIAISHTSYSCDCMGWPANIGEAVQIAYREADLVLTGKVVSIERTKIIIEHGSPMPPSKLEGEITNFEVGTVWKGSPGKTISTKIVTECCMCGISFKSGKEYLLYLYKADEAGYYQTGDCDRTTEIENATKDIEVLEKMPNQAFNADSLQRGIASQFYAPLQTTSPASRLRSAG